MRLKREEISKIAHLIFKNLKERTLITPRVSENKIVYKIEAVVLKNLEQEAAIEEEVKKIMEQYKAQISTGTIDPQKAYMMIKKQVAKERKFIL